MDALSTMLESTFGVPVIDETHLTGTYDQHSRSARHGRGVPDTPRRNWPACDAVAACRLIPRGAMIATCLRARLVWYISGHGLRPRFARRRGSEHPQRARPDVRIVAVRSAVNADLSNAR